MFIPEKMKAIIGQRPLSASNVGLSGASVYVMPDMVLKVERMGAVPQREADMMAWLQGRLPVPQLLDVERQDGMQYLLMSRVPGEMMCAPYWLARPDQLLEHLAEALHSLWCVPVTDCPCPAILDDALRAAEERVAAGLCHMDDVEPDTYGPGRFASPETLLKWLLANRPEETLVLSHGDLCLPNVFASARGMTGLIDLGWCGVADPCRDLALCYRSLRHNTDGSRGAPPVEGFEPGRLFDVLGMKPDWDKMRYYHLLDELF